SKVMVSAPANGLWLLELVTSRARCEVVSVPVVSRMRLSLFWTMEPEVLRGYHLAVSTPEPTKSSNRVWAEAAVAVNRRPAKMAAPRMRRMGWWYFMVFLGGKRGSGSGRGGDGQRRHDGAVAGEQGVDVLDGDFARVAVGERGERGGGAGGLAHGHGGGLHAEGGVGLAVAAGAAAGDEQASAVAWQERAERDGRKGAGTERPGVDGAARGGVQIDGIKAVADRVG